VPVLDLGKEIKKHIVNDNMLGWQYNTIGVSDGITMGGEGMRIIWKLFSMILTMIRYAILTANP
jgi:dihydroxyacid dehydratase/phosphogluconate dehydratase